MDRSRRYPSDLTDAQWELIEPMLPLRKWMSRPEKHPRGAIVDAILYVVRTGCAWRYLPADFPLWETVYGRFRQWNKRGVTEKILTELREQVRISQGRNPEPSTGIIDSQSVKAADTVRKATRGYDARNYLGWLVMPGRTLLPWCRGVRPGMTTGLQEGQEGVGRAVAFRVLAVWCGPGQGDTRAPSSASRGLEVDRCLGQAARPYPVDQHPDSVIGCGIVVDPAERYLPVHGFSWT